MNARLRPPLIFATLKNSSAEWMPTALDVSNGRVDRALVLDLGPGLWGAGLGHVGAGHLPIDEDAQTLAEGPARDTVTPLSP